MCDFKVRVSRTLAANVLSKNYFLLKQQIFLLNPALVISSVVEYLPPN